MQPPVPGITGQLVLGAKAGMASALTQGIGSAAERAGGAAGSGYTSDLTQGLRANQESVGQAAKAAHYQRGGLAAKVLEASNAQTMAGIQGSAISAKATKADRIGQGAQQTASGWQTVGGQFDSNLGALTASAPGDGLARAGAGLRAANTTMTAGKQLDALATQKAANAVGFFANAEGFEARATESALGAGSRMMQARTQFGAEQAAFRAQNKMGAQLDGWASARGVSAGMLGGQKTSPFEGLAASGLSGQEAKDQASRFDPFGFNGGGGVYSSISQEAAGLGNKSDAPGADVAPSLGEYNEAYWKGVGGRAAKALEGTKIGKEALADFNKATGGNVQSSFKDFAGKLVGNVNETASDATTAIPDPPTPGATWVAQQAKILRTE